MEYIHQFISITTLNVNGLNAPIKKQRLQNWIKEYNYMMPNKKLMLNRKINRFKSKRGAWGGYDMLTIKEKQ